MYSIINNHNTQQLICVLYKFIIITKHTQHQNFAHMKNNLKTELQRLQNMQNAIFQQIDRHKAQTLQQLQRRQEISQRQQSRKQSIQTKTNKEIVTHPNNNQVWFQLAHFVDEQQLIDLNEIENRRRERQQIRQQMERKRQIAESKNQINSQIKSEISNHKKEETVKVSWKLMRELRRKEVEQNKARLQRIEQNKRQKIHHYHKY